ncbi:MAG: hypothetical protein EA428_14160 [Spirochaetaceae bacterium]|nr:MAG: hypothetical protein EA428_14160 [Spirochaetaceae bacterium]
MQKNRVFQRLGIGLCLSLLFLLLPLNEVLARGSREAAVEQAPPRSVETIRYQGVYGRDSSIGYYFYRIGVLETPAIDATESLRWGEFAGYLQRGLPGFEPEELGRSSDIVPTHTALRLFIQAMDHSEFVLTYHDLDDLDAAVIETAGLIGLIAERDVPAELSRGAALRMLLQARQNLGLYVPYLGHIEDPSIYRLSREKRTSINADTTRAYQEAVPRLFELGNRGLTQVPGGAFTGYNIKDYNEMPIFARDLMIRYDHGNVGHILQMISLMRREGFDARIDVKPRISSYVHHIDEWGPPSPGSITTPLSETRAIVHGASFDILIEFATQVELEAYMPMIERYALRKEQDTTGLIRAPYYAPLYASTQELPGYEELMGIQAVLGSYYLQSYVLPDYIDIVVDTLRNIDPDIRIETNTYFVNPQFVGYLENNLTND